MRTVRLTLTIPVLLVATFMSGCIVGLDHAGRSQASQSTSTHIVNGCDASKLNQTAHPQDIQIKESQDVVGALDKRWSWNVDNFTFKSFTIRLDIEGPAGGPQYASEGLGFKFTAGPCAGYKRTQSGSSPWINSGGRIELVQYSPRGVEGWGAWSMELKSSTAVIHYTVNVVVDY